jgi:hypothetical protein
MKGQPLISSIPSIVILRSPEFILSATKDLRSRVNSVTKDLALKTRSFADAQDDVLSPVSCILTPDWASDGPPFPRA